MIRCVLGGDPGKTGAIAAVSLEPGNALLGVVDVPIVGKDVSIPLLARAVAELTAELDVVASAVEKVGAMPGQGRQSMYVFGEVTGLMLMVLGASWPLARPTSPVWKKHFRLPDKKVDRAAARRAAIQRWPGCADLFARAKDDGRADAALIALWCAETQPIARGVAA